MNNKTGYIHIYYGDGKGKTTSAIGLAIRAAGAGYRIYISRFLKNDKSSELNILQSISNIHVSGSEKDFGFFFHMSEETKKEAKEFFTFQLTNAFQQSKEYDMLILDEINVAVDLGLVDESLLINYMQNKPKHLELILTGRNPSKKMLSLADYASEIKCQKHPFNKGISSRTGIEE